MPRIKVLISGAGIAGNALAFWLAKLDYCDVTVVERFPNLRTTGLQIDLRGAGVDVLRRMDLEKEFRARAAPELGLQLVDKSGRRRAYFPVNKSGNGAQSFTSEFEIMRGDLCRLMYDATGKDRIRYVFGTSIENYEEKEDGSVEVRFMNGTTELFNLVVGADGVGSRTRKIMIGCQNDIKDPSFHPHGNSYIAYFTVRRPMAEGEEYVAKFYVATKHRILLTRRHNENEMQVYLMCRSDSERLRNAHRGDTAEEKEAMDEIYRGAGWQTDDILKLMRNADDFYCERQGLIKLDAWSRGHVTLVGDAAYCPSANGFGTTTAMVGAYILAGEIGTHCGRSGGGGGADGRGDANLDGLTAALKAYEEKLRPFMMKMHKEEENSNMMPPSSPFGVAIFNNIMGIASFLRLDRIVMKFYHPDQDLKLPGYEDVLRV